MQCRQWPACWVRMATSDHMDDVPKTPAKAPSLSHSGLLNLDIVVFIFVCSEIQLHSKQICVYFKRLEIENKFLPNPSEITVFIV